MRADQLTAEHVGRTLTITRGKYAVTATLDRPPQTIHGGEILVHLRQQMDYVDGEQINYTRLQPDEEVELRRFPPCAAVVTQPHPDLWRAECSCGWVNASPDPGTVLRNLVEHHKRPVDRDDPDVFKVLAEHRRTAVRADAVPCCPHREGGPHSVLCQRNMRPSRRRRWAEAFASFWVCPDCLLPRFMPTHWFHR